MIVILDGPVLRELLDQFHRQKRFTTIPDYTSYLISEQLDKMCNDELDRQMKEAVDKLEKKDKKNK